MSGQLPKNNYSGDKVTGGVESHFIQDGDMQVTKEQLNENTADERAGSPLVADASFEKLLPETSIPRPIQLDDFLAQEHLMRGDVVLTSPMGKLSSALIRWAIRSEFSHAAMMFLVPDQTYGFGQHYLIESGPSGVDITALSEYSDAPDGENIIGINRFEAPWFNEKMRSLASGRMLRFIKEDYDYSKAGGNRHQVEQGCFQAT